MPFAAALSEHPVPAEALGEVAGQILETLGSGPDVALLFVTPPHAGALEDMATAVMDILRPGVLVGAAAVSVVGTDREVEQDAAVSLWAGRLGDAEAVRLEAVRSADGGVSIEGWPPALSFEPTALVLVADPFSFPVEVLYTEVEKRYPGLPVIGGNASAARGPGGNRLVLDRGVHTGGAVGVFIGSGVEIETVVSQGCRPIGVPYIVTRADGYELHELAGQPALSRLIEMSKRMSEDDIDQINAGLHLGQVIDEHKERFERGDFLMRNVVGAQEASGAIVVGNPVEVGATVQFHVRDAATADEDLRQLLDGRRADGALLFTCNGRGVALFDMPDHDAAVLHERVGAPATGFFAAGEFGPVGGRNFVHGFTASIALFRDR